MQFLIFVSFNFNYFIFLSFLLSWILISRLSNSFEWNAFVTNFDLIYYLFVFQVNIYMYIYILLQLYLINCKSSDYVMNFCLEIYLERYISSSIWIKYHLPFDIKIIFMTVFEKSQWRTNVTSRDTWPNPFNAKGFSFEHFHIINCKINEINSITMKISYWFI